MKMANQIKFNVCSGNKSYATAENASKAAMKKFGENNTLRFFVTQIENGRFIPVFIGEPAIRAGVHFHFHVVA